MFREPTAKPSSEIEHMMMTQGSDYEYEPAYLERIAKYVDQLQPEQRELLEAVFYQRMSYSELGEELGVSKVQAWRLTRKACRTLSELICADPELNERYNNGLPADME